MVLACIEMIPLENDLGPAVISILLDECSLAPKVTNNVKRKHSSCSTCKHIGLN